MAQNPCASTAATVGTGMALLSYVASVVGANIPDWVNALATGAVIAGSLSFSREGIVGVWRTILYGRSG